MKLANLGGRAALIVGDDLAIDVATASDGRFGPDVQPLYERWDELLAFAAELDTSPAAPFDPERLEAPVPSPRQVFAIGINYGAHAEETGKLLPSVPATFTKFPAALNGPFADIELPAETVDWEVELVVAIGRRADRVDEADAWSHVAGLTAGQDLSERTMQMAAGAQFSLGKSYRGFGPLGPLLVTPDELDDPDDLALGCAVNGETMQDGRTSDLVFTVPALIGRLSAVLPLLAGDVIFTGTPSGVGMSRQPPRFLAVGDILETWIEGIGSMRHRFIAPP